MSWTCGSCGHNQPGPGKCAKCMDTNLVADDARLDPWRLAKTKGDVLMICRHNERIWWILDSEGSLIESWGLLAEAKYACRAHGMEFRVEESTEGV